MKECVCKVNDWPKFVPHAFFADRITVRRQTGYSPYYLLHGQDPVLPFDLTESTFLVDGYRRGMTSEDLLALRIRQLQKRPEDLAKAAEVLKRHRFQAKEQFERRYKTRLVKDSYPSGTLVLIRNKAKENTNQKHFDRYLGPYEVVRQTRNGAYVLQELDGTIWRQAIAAFRLIPYVSRSSKYLRDIMEELAEGLEEDSDTDAWISEVSEDDYESQDEVLKAAEADSDYEDDKSSSYSSSD